MSGTLSTNATGPLSARFAHVNLIARDWRALSAFYRDVFGCTPVPPERDYRGPTVEAGTGVVGAAFRGIHLRLPGGGEGGPTIEIYEYTANVEPSAPPVANRLGWGHIAFVVEDVDAAHEAALGAGASAVGEIVTTTIADGRRVTWCYVADPEGNLVELQHWSPASDR